MLADEEGDRALYLDLELPSDRAKLADPELYFASHEGKLVILDDPSHSRHLPGPARRHRPPTAEGNQGR